MDGQVWGEKKRYRWYHEFVDLRFRPLYCRWHWIPNNVRACFVGITNWMYWMRTQNQRGGNSKSLSVENQRLCTGPAESSQQGKPWIGLVCALLKSIKCEGECWNCPSSSMVWTRLGAGTDPIACTSIVEVWAQFGFVPNCL